MRGKNSWASANLKPAERPLAASDIEAAFRWMERVSDEERERRAKWERRYGTLPELMGPSEVRNLARLSEKELLGLGVTKRGVRELKRLAERLEPRPSTTMAVVDAFLREVFAPRAKRRRKRR